jgi:diguanylate cyclase (GGDEF)-like protein
MVQAAGTRRRRLLAALGTSLLVLFLVIEILLLRSYQQTERTTRDFSDTTGTTTAIANLQREALLIEQQIARLPAGRGRSDALAAVELRRGLLARQLDVVSGAASRRPALGRRIGDIKSTLSRFDRAFSALARRGTREDERSQRSELERSLRLLGQQVKETFNEEEHALYAALTHTLHDRANDQRLVVGLSALALLLGCVLAAAIWRAVRGDFARAYAALAAEAAEREVLQEQLRHQATHDSLTGLPNRVKFQSDLESTRPGSPDRLAVLYVDLDGFKGVNDSLGHDVGDELLREVARRLRESIRPGDRVARLGGDEFVVLLEGVRDPAIALDTAERLRTAVSAHWRVHGRTVRVGASVGVALGDADINHADELVARADLAMYAAKRGGKGDVRLYDPAVQADGVARAQLETGLRGAIERGELGRPYQPIIDLPS